MNKGRPSHEKHICICCTREFSTSKKKANHEYQKRKNQQKRTRTEATQSLAGNLATMRDFTTPTIVPVNEDNTNRTNEFQSPKI
jgi:hypothetical protein